MESRFAPLSEPGFRWLLASRIASGTALTGLRAAVAWHVYDLTGSVFQLGLLGIVQFVPALGLALVGGAVADARDRRTIAIVAQLLELLCALALVLATASGRAAVGLLFGLIVVGSAAAAFENPARAALLPLLVSRERFPAAVAIHSVGQALAFMSGPALAGLAIAAGGVQAAYAGTAALLAVSAAGLTRLRPRAPEGERRRVSLQAIREGLAFVRAQPVVLGCMPLDMFAVIFGGATALLPDLLSDILGVGPAGYGLLSGSLEAGALGMSVMLMLSPADRAAGRALLLAVGLLRRGHDRLRPLALVPALARGLRRPPGWPIRSAS